MTVNVSSSSGCPGEGAFPPMLLPYSMVPYNRMQMGLAHQNPQKWNIWFFDSRWGRCQQLTKRTFCAFITTGQELCCTVSWRKISPSSHLHVFQVWNFLWQAYPKALSSYFKPCHLTMCISPHCLAVFLFTGRMAAANLVLSHSS